jgi:DNA-binding NarL/FixJ family response regulator
MAQRILVFVTASDPVSQSGIESQLRGRPRCAVVEQMDVDRADVAVVVVDEIDEVACRTIRALQRDGVPRVVVVAQNPDDSGLMQAIEAGASGFVRRSDATAETLERAIETAERGDGALPGDLLGRLMERIGDLQRNVLTPAGLTASGLTSREVEVLRLVSEGMDTCQISSELHYSERTVKNVIHDVTTRFNLRNRSHAVAYAVRNGLI